jgi:hypothetical protein
MSKWTFGLCLVLLTISPTLSVRGLLTYKPPQELCLLNIVMVKGTDMYVQKGLWPTHCVNISKD